MRPASPPNPVLLDCIRSGDVSGPPDAATMPVRMGSRPPGLRLSGGPARGRGRCHRSARRAGGAGRFVRQASKGKGGGGAAGLGSRAHLGGRPGPALSPRNALHLVRPALPDRKSTSRPAGTWWLRAATGVLRMLATPESTLWPPTSLGINCYSERTPLAYDTECNP